MSLFNRAEVIDQNFTHWVESGNLPEEKSEQKLSKNDILKTDLISLTNIQLHNSHCLPLVSHYAQDTAPYKLGCETLVANW